MKAIYKNLEITAEYIKTLSQNEVWEGSRNGLMTNKFEVTVTSEHDSITFYFHGSHQDYLNGKIELSEDELLSAFDCFLADAICGDLSFDEFCSQLGYDEDSRRAEKIHKSCEDSFSDFQSLNVGNIYDFSNEFREAHENII